MLRALFDKDLLLREQRTDALTRVLGHAVVVLQLEPRAQVDHLAHGSHSGIAVQHAQSRGHTGVQRLGHARARAVLHTLKIEYLALARLAHGQRQHDGQNGVRVKTVGVLDGKSRTREHALEGAHHVEVRNVGRLLLLNKNKP